MLQLMLWSAMLSSQFIFVLAAVMATGGDFTTLTAFSVADFSSRLSTPVLGVMAPLAVTMFAIAAFFGTVFTAKIRTKLMSQGIVPGTPRYEQAMFAPFILRLSVLESISILGLVVAIDARSSAMILPFFCLALVGFVMAMPRTRAA